MQDICYICTSHTTIQTKYTTVGCKQGLLSNARSKNCCISRDPYSSTHRCFVLYKFLQLPLPPHSQQPLTHCHNLREDWGWLKGVATPPSCAPGNVHILSNSHRWSRLESYSVQCDVSLNAWACLSWFWVLEREVLNWLNASGYYVYIPVTTYTVYNLLSSFTKLHGFKYTICMKWPKVEWY